MLFVVESVKFIGEGEYNLNVLKEIKVTDSYLGLDQRERGCQNEEPPDTCTTRKYRKTILGKCGCLPVNIRLFNEVFFLIIVNRVTLFILQSYIFQETLCSTALQMDCVKNVNVDISSCQKPCSGLIVTSFAQSKLENDLETLFPISKEYAHFKKITPYPSAVKGRIKLRTDSHLILSI